MPMLHILASAAGLYEGLNAQDPCKEQREYDQKSVIWKTRSLVMAAFGAILTVLAFMFGGSILQLCCLGLGLTAALLCFAASSYYTGWHDALEGTSRQVMEHPNVLSGEKAGSWMASYQAIELLRDDNKRSGYFGLYLGTAHLAGLPTSLLLEDSLVPAGATRQYLIECFLEERAESRPRCKVSLKDEKIAVEYGHGRHRVGVVVALEANDQAFLGENGDVAVIEKLVNQPGFYDPEFGHLLDTQTAILGIVGEGLGDYFQNEETYAHWATQSANVQSALLDADLKDILLEKVDATGVYRTWIDKVTIAATSTSAQIAETAKSVLG